MRIDHRHISVNDAIDVCIHLTALVYIQLDLGGRDELVDLLICVAVSHFVGWRLRVERSCIPRVRIHPITIRRGIHVEVAFLVLRAEYWVRMNFEANVEASLLQHGVNNLTGLVHVRIGITCYQKNFSVLATRFLEQGLCFVWVVLRPWLDVWGMPRAALVIEALRDRPLAVEDSLMDTFVVDGMCCR